MGRRIVLNLILRYKKGYFWFGIEHVSRTHRRGACPPPPPPPHDFFFLSVFLVSSAVSHVHYDNTSSIPLPQALY